MRVIDLAKELGVSSKEVMDACHGHGIECKSHFKAVDPGEETVLRRHFGDGPALPPEPVEEKKAAPTPEELASAPRQAARPVAPRQAAKRIPRALVAGAEHRPAEAEAEAPAPAPVAEQAPAQAPASTPAQAAAPQQAPAPQSPPPPQPRPQVGLTQDEVRAARKAAEAVIAARHQEESAKRQAEAEKRLAEERARREAEELKRQAEADAERARRAAPLPGSRLDAAARKAAEERVRKASQERSRQDEQRRKKSDDDRARRERERKASDEAERIRSELKKAAESSGSSDNEADKLAREAVARIDHRAHRHKRADFRAKTVQPVADAAPEVLVKYEDLLDNRRSGVRRKRKRKKFPDAPGMSGAPGQPLAAQLRTGPSKTSLRKRAIVPEGVVELSPPVTLRSISGALGVKLSDIMKLLLNQGVMVGINDLIDDEMAETIAAEYNKEVKFIRDKDAEQELAESVLSGRDETRLVARPPVIAFLGHVDHGKTSLLDCIRKSHVVDTESGGITQHIGAYRVKVGDGMLCILDTPGHEAFSNMRARGANLTDIVVLVCAADDGVMPQTREAYAHAKAAGVPVVVALNKCDLPGANPQKAMQELSSLDENLLPEQWGGKAGMIQCSAITGQGIPELLERILLESEMLPLKTDPERRAEGRVLEARMTPDRGVIANVLIQDGTIRRGDVMLSGPGYGRAKLMFDENGKTISSASASTPVQICGLSELPEAGERFHVLEDLQQARSIAEKRSTQARKDRLTARAHVSLTNLTEYLATTQVKELRVVLKADVMGSLEVLKKTLSDLVTSEVKVNVIHSGVGGINQADVILADASDALIVGFHVSADTESRAYADSRQVEIKIYHVIYHMVDDLKAALSGLLPPERKELVQGHVEIRQVFKVSRLGNIAGCFVKDGIVNRQSGVRIFRDNVLVYEGKLASLHRFKDQVKEVREGYECGLRIENYDNIKEGDLLEAYTTEEFARTLA